MENAILRRSFSWDCPRCGTENHQRAVPVELTGEHARAALLTAGQLEEWEEIDSNTAISLTRVPDMVTCHQCREMYEPWFPNPPILMPPSKPNNNPPAPDTN